MTNYSADIPPTPSADIPSAADYLIAQPAINAVNMRKTHPGLFWLTIVCSVWFTALGLNFFFTTPPFNPLNIPYFIVGSVFLALGLSKLVFLNVIRRLKVVRWLMTFEIFVSMGWACGATITGVQGLTSFQLPIMYFGLAFFEFFLLREPFWNPLTQTQTVPLQNGSSRSDLPTPSPETSTPPKDTQ